MYPQKCIFEINISQSDFHSPSLATMPIWATSPLQTVQELCVWGLRCWVGGYDPDSVTRKQSVISPVPIPWQHKVQKDSSMERASCNHLKLDLLNLFHLFPGSVYPPGLAASALDVCIIFLAPLTLNHYFTFLCLICYHPSISWYHWFSLQNICCNSDCLFTSTTQPWFTLLTPKLLSLMTV